MITILIGHLWSSLVILVDPTMPPPRYSMSSGLKVFGWQNLTSANLALRRRKQGLRWKRGPVYWLIVRKFFPGSTIGFAPMTTLTRWSVGLKVVWKNPNSLSVILRKCASPLHRLCLQRSTKPKGSSRRPLNGADKRRKKTCSSLTWHWTQWNFIFRIYFKIGTCETFKEILCIWFGVWFSIDFDRNHLISGPWSSI